MRKFGVLLLTILISTLIAGIYGAIHDQITFTICPEYFTVFKFDQFHFQEWGNNNPRLTTALIGFLATWWVGLYIGIFQGLVGLTHRTPKLMLKYVMDSMFITLGVAFLFGIVGGISGVLDGETFPSCFPYEVQDCKNFHVVGSIHGFGYTGGEVGAVIGLAYQILKRKSQASS